jgi:hypothetical protein
MSNWGFVRLAYGLAYAILIGYWAYVQRQSRDAERLAKREGQP